MVRSAKPQHAGGSTQGYYVLTGDGTGLLWDNYLPRLAQFLDRGLAAFRQRPPRPGGSSPEPARLAAPQAPPPGASVLRLYTRIRPLPAGAGPMNAMLGRDSMWVLREEIQEIVAASNRGGEAFELPRTLATRLVRFHMVDNTRGQVWPWNPRSVRSAVFTARTLRSKGGVRTLSFTGSFAKEDAHPPQWTDRGHEGKVEGEFDVDLAASTLLRFRALAECRAWRDAGYDRVATPPPGRYPVVTALVEATDELARQVAPEPAAAGNAYLRPSP